MRFVSFPTSGESPSLAKRIPVIGPKQTNANLDTKEINPAFSANIRTLFSLRVAVRILNKTALKNYSTRHHI